MDVVQAAARRAAPDEHYLPADAGAQRARPLQAGGGEGLARLFHERFPATAVLLLSSNDEDALRRSAEKLGAAGFVCKGDPADLRRRVRSVLGRP